MIGIVGYFKYMENAFGSLDRQQQRVYPSNMDLFYLPELDATATQVLFPKEKQAHQPGAAQATWY